MKNPFENYPSAWMTDTNNPIIYAITAEQMWHFMNAQDCDPLTGEEWAELPYAFSDVDCYDFLEVALSALRPKHRNQGF